MALIAIEKEHHLSHKKAKEAAEKVAEDLHARFDLEYRWKGDAIEFRRPGLTGALSVGKDDVRLDCELGFMLSLLKPTIETEVHKQFDKYFGKARPKSKLA
jgi:putative polyhydroxyalkanoate system protein